MATPVLSYGSESWTITQRDKQKIQTVEMKFLRRVKGCTLRDQIRNEHIREELGVYSVNEKIAEARENGLQHIDRMDDSRHMTDAVHPFFTGYRHQMADAETSTSDDLRYFCKECDLYFPLSSAAVLDHFEKRAHMPIDSCVYCGGPVCEYFYNGVRSVYHNCGQGTATNSVNSSVIGTIRNKISSCEIS
ncbi:hypothetical protein GE061_017631 [Apolygus lucorum]|uniref:Uncharacterized protein n=1 Tax=Apolygus lucorum TaxID=248454 RepID=A0A8S9XDN5_APOLU|nr:hypothetical protein GE061_017631 [Apolygus lucorum]